FVPMGDPVMVKRRGRPAAANAEQRGRVLALAEQGLAQREIAEQVFGDARYRGRVERILHQPPARPVPELAHREGVDFEALLAGGSDFAIIVELVARYERWLLESGTVAAPAEIEGLLRIKRQAAAVATVERLK